MKKRIVVGMSGGVDSSLTAALLKEQGHDVLGVYMQNWSDEAAVLPGCANWEQDRRDALRVAGQLEIPFKVLDFEKQYRQRVIDYFFAEYQEGRTPNPDVLCNREIKFGMLLDWAQENGYEYVATGHYAQVEHSESGSKLFKGIDQTKDQSYFLSQLSQDQLQHALFPLGGMLKKDVRSEAAKRNLVVSEKPDSQGLCFVGEINLGEFLKQRIPVEPGKVLTTAGEVVGKHEGAPYYTIGQRRGVGVASGVPMYVLGTDIQKNTVTVGHDRELYKETLFTEQPHWVSGNASDLEKFSISIRYRMKAEPAQVERSDKGLKITFDEAQRGPTPGQFAVLYDGDELIGSAVIC